jgi:hypothetical protein
MANLNRFKGFRVNYPTETAIDAFFLINFNKLHASIVFQSDGISIADI